MKNETVTIAEIQQAKLKMENELYEVIDSFEKRYSILVRDINIERVKYMHGEDDIISVLTEIDIDQF